MKYSFVISVVVAMLGAIGWVVSVVLSVLSAGKFRMFAIFFGALMIISIPLGIVAEIIRRRKKS